MKIEFKVLSLSNFMSYGKNRTIVNLGQTGTTLILGENLDDTANGQISNGVGKAQPLYCKIKTPNGWVSMKDVAVDDIISTPDGGTARVVGVYPQGNRPVFRITFEDGRHTDADADHLWKVFSHRWGRRGDRGEKILTTKELQQHVNDPNTGKFPSYRIFIPNVKGMRYDDKSFQNDNLPLDPYLLGVLLGDGGLSDSQPKISSTDAEIVERTNSILLRSGQRLCLFGKNNIKDYTICNIKSRSKGNFVRERLIELGLWGTHSHNKYIPPQYLEADIQSRIRLLQGLLDTDGTVGKTHNISFSSSSFDLAKGVQYLVRSLGGKAKCSVRHPFYKDKDGNRRNGRTSYNISITYGSPKDLFTLSRKRERLHETTQYADAGLRVVDIKYIGDDYTQCIMIDHPDHLYITDDFIVTHNTTIMNALTYALYDRSISDIKIDELVNNINGKHMEVTVEFEKDGVVYHVKRKRKSGKTGRENGVSLFINGEDKTRDSVKNTDTAIQEIIGMPYDMFVRIVVISANHTPFLDMPVTSHYQANQTDFIERLFNLTVLSEQAVLLKDMIKSSEDSMNVHKVRIEQIEKEHKRYDEQLLSARNRVNGWNITNKKTIETHQLQLEEVEAVDVEAEQKLQKEIDVLEKKIRESQQEKKQLKNMVHRYEKMIEQSTHELEHLTQQRCPYCMQQYADAHLKIDQCKTTLEDASQKLQDFSKELEFTEEDERDLAALLKIIKKKKKVDDIDELIELHSQKQAIQQKIEDLKRMVNPFLEPLAELESTPVEPIDYEDLNKLQKLQDHQSFLLKLLTKKDSFVRKALLNKNLPFLNARLHHYLSQLGLTHKVEFTHEMTASISLFGRPLSFGNLSNGQRARVNLALALAFRDVLQKLHTPINICLLDEVLDVGLDAVGVQSAGRMLKRKARDEGLNIFIISHRDEIGSIFDRTMVVQMEKGFSKIKDITEEI